MESYHVIDMTPADEQSMEECNVEVREKRCKCVGKTCIIMMLLLLLGVDLAYTYAVDKKVKDHINSVDIQNTAVNQTTLFNTEHSAIRQINVESAAKEQNRNTSHYPENPTASMLTSSSSSSSNRSGENKRRKSKSRKGKPTFEIESKCGDELTVTMKSLTEFDGQVGEELCYESALVVGQIKISRHPDKGVVITVRCCKLTVKKKR